jgi:hypothetical protein
VGEYAEVAPALARRRDRGAQRTPVPRIALTVPTQMRRGVSFQFFVIDIGEYVPSVSS